MERVESAAHVRQANEMGSRARLWIVIAEVAYGLNCSKRAYGLGSVPRRGSKPP